MAKKTEEQEIDNELFESLKYRDNDLLMAEIDEVVRQNKVNVVDINVKKIVKKID